MPKCPKDCHIPNPPILRRVVIPATLGDDTANPPENGTYCNALVIYEANNAIYIYTSDGIPTKIPTSITSYNELTHKPMINGVELEGDVSLSELGIEGLINSTVALEAAARVNADSALQNAINNERDARIAADQNIISQIPTVNDATLTLQKNGSDLGTFTANSSTDTTINIDVPIYTSGLINDSGYVTSAALTDYATDQEVSDAVATEASLRESADQGLQSQIDAIASSSDVVDVVGTYADLQSYDTTKLKDNDIIKVLTDSTHDNAISYYRWDDVNDTFVYIGSQGPFYTKSETDATFVPQTRTVNGKALSTDITLTATDVSALPASTVIPTVNDATLTLQKNGNTVATFTANSASNVTANIAVPVNTSDLINDSDFATTSDIPTKTSELINDGSDNTAQYLETDETAYRTTSIPYGECDSTSTATVFTATVPGITELRDGVCMWLKNGVVTSASGFTININNLGAKPVYSNMAAATRDTTIWNVNYTMFFVYDSTRVEGGCWILYRGYNSDNNTIGYQVRTNSQSLPMTSIVYRYRLLFTSADNAHYVPANNSTSTNATASRTVCQDKINPFGRIFYYGTTASVAANSRPGATYLWEQYAISLGYSFNRTGAALTLTQWKPVYVKCAPQSDGSAIIDSTTPYVQDLPTTEDGKIYIFLGIAYSATNIELQLDHPVYYYKDGMIRPYTNPAAQNITVDSALSPTSENPVQNKVINSALGDKANSADLATVATTGLYSDLTGAPTIPTVNDATLTIQRNGTTVDTFTANASQDKTINIAVPTATSDLTNDSGFLTSIPTASANTLGGVMIGAGLSITDGVLSVTGGGVADAVEWTNVLNRPSNVSYWTNDAGYITSASLPTKTSDLINDGSNSTSTYVEASSLATVATSGSYTDLTNKPTIPTVNNGTLTIQRNGTTVDTFTANASVDKAINIVVPTKTSDLTNDSGFLDSVAWGDITGKPTFATVATSGSYNDLLDKPTLSDEIFFINVISFSGSAGMYTITVDKTYSEIMSAYQDGKVLIVRADVNSVPDSGFPASSVDYVYAELYHVAVNENAGSTTTSFFFFAGETSGNGRSITAHSHIFAIQDQYASYSRYFGSITVTDIVSNVANPVSSNAVLNALATKANSADLATVATSGSYNDLTNKPTLATVATSGSYTDLSNKPTIPTVNDATLTIQKNGTTVKTFTANASSNVTANITVPTKTSDLTNDSGFVTGSIVKANGSNLGTTTIDSTTANYMEVTKLTTATDLDTLQTTGIYIVGASGNTNAPTSNWGTIFVDWTVGTHYQLYIPDSDNTTIYKRKYSSGTWGSWAPIVNNGTLTIQKNGTNVQTFTANQSSNATANITVPTKVSELTSDVGGNSFYGTCTTAAATAAKEVTVSSDQNFVLKTGVMVTFKAPNTNTAQNPTINVNNTGAKQIWFNTAVVTTGSLNRAGQNGRPATYVYDGTYWVWESWSADDNTTYSTMSVAEGKTGTATSARTMRADYLKQIIDYHIRTADNLSPAGDTTAEWKTALGSVNGSYYTWYSTAGTFTHQPSQYGFLETFMQGGDIYQRWHTQSSGPILYRSGNSSGWSNPSDGTWNTVATTANIPTVNNGTLTIQKNGTNVQTFTANQSSNATANITVPTKTSDLVNDSGYISGTITSNQIADAAVTIAKIDRGAVITSKIGAYAVTTDKIDAGAVTTAKINNGAVTTGKIADANVTDAKLAHDADFSSEVLIGKFGNEILYKLILTDTSATAINTWKPLSTTIDMTNFGRIVSIKGTIRGSGATEYYPMNAESQNFIVYFSGGTFSERHSGTYYNNRAITVEVEFTRTA